MKIMHVELPKPNLTNLTKKTMNKSKEQNNKRK